MQVHVVCSASWLHGVSFYATNCFWSSFVSCDGPVGTHTCAWGRISVILLPAVAVSRGLSPCIWLGSTSWLLI